ncbi:Hypothetical protein CINCED_3A007174 [Cinara cedri]|uniref:Uncharacterized protein n=1 Tax=Cinara cedri TaxID=506608 RepID=A0A5E4NDT3_9HEMI|nr:Hypothetical protein CINCED_3A007174 [Cinara cedri]
MVAAQRPNPESIQPLPKTIRRTFSILLHWRDASLRFQRNPTPLALLGYFQQLPRNPIESLYDNYAMDGIPKSGFAGYGSSKMITEYECLPCLVFLGSPEFPDYRLLRIKYSREPSEFSIKKYAFASRAQNEYSHLQSLIISLYVYLRKCLFTYLRN